MQGNGINLSLVLAIRVHINHLVNGKTKDGSEKRLL